MQPDNNDVDNNTGSDVNNDANSDVNNDANNDVYNQTKDIDNTAFFKAIHDYPTGSRDPKEGKREKLSAVDPTQQPDRLIEGHVINDPWPLTLFNPLPNRKKGPNGYKKNWEDPFEWVLDPPIAAAFEKAFYYLDQGFSLNDCLNFLKAEYGIAISRDKLNRIYYSVHGHTEAAKQRKERFRPKHSWRHPKTGKEKAEFARKDKKMRAKLTASRIESADERRESKKRAGKTGENSNANNNNVVDGNNTDNAAVDDNSPPTDTTNTPPQRVIFKPNPGPQTEYLAASEQEVLYGGQAGGGKTVALIADPLRYFHERMFQGILVRRTLDELRDVIWETHRLYPDAFPGAKWNEKKSQWTFPSGARMWFTFLEREQDVLRYQGQAFQYIAFDELTQHPTPFAWTYLSSRLRSPEADLPLIQRAATNPGGPGHIWCKRMFIDPAPPDTPFPATDIETDEILRWPEHHQNGGNPLFYRRFIPSKLSDNPYLYKDGRYEANLLALPETQRRQLLEGDWDVVSGQEFSEFRRHTHTCSPFDVPKDWIKFRSCDYGFSTASAIHWYAIDPQYSVIYVYRELYVSRLTAHQLARLVMEQEQEDERVLYGVLDSSCWHQRGNTGPSIAEEMIRAGCLWKPSDRTAGSRVSGKNRIHELLRIDPGVGLPGIVFFDTCRKIISTLPSIPSDPKGSDDVDPKFREDHDYDSLRYGVMSRPHHWLGYNRPVRATPYRPADPVFGY